MGLTLGSLFDGIGGWLLAAIKNGITPIWSSEIDEFAMKVSKAHFPDVKQLGDITKLNGGEIPPVDIVCAGSPCQDLSVAGCRKGLKGERSNLFYEAVRITREMKERTNGNYPTYFVWENVTGAFSSNHGRDFQGVLSTITQGDIPMPESGRWAKAGMVRSEGVGIAWRTLDAQCWGVPQHRERVFLIADFRGGGAVEVLFKPESVCRDAQKGGKASQTAPGATTECTGNTKQEPGKNWGAHHRCNLCGGRAAKSDLHEAVGGNTNVWSCGSMGVDNGKEMKLYESHGQDGRYNERKIAPTLTRRMGTGGGNVPMVIDDKRVRRLTPLECERLQGLPDNYTAYGSDTERYRVIGNGMAQPCADFILAKVLEMSQNG